MGNTTMTNHKSLNPWIRINCHTTTDNEHLTHSRTHLQFEVYKVESDVLVLNNEQKKITLTEMMRVE